MIRGHDFAHQQRILDFVGERICSLGDVADGLYPDSPDATRGQMTLLIEDEYLILHDDLRVELNWDWKPIRWILNERKARESERAHG